MAPSTKRGSEYIFLVWRSHLARSAPRFTDQASPGLSFDLPLKEDRLAIVSGLDDVMRKGRDRDATGARHDRVPQRSRFPTVLAGLPGVKKIVL